MVSTITLDPYSIEKSPVLMNLAMVNFATPGRLTELVLAPPRRQLHRRASGSGPTRNGQRGRWRQLHHAQNVLGSHGAIGDAGRQPR